MALEQAKRKIQLGLLAKDMAAARGGDARGERARRHLVERLGRLDGLPQKIGQILSLTELREDEGLFMTLTEAPAAMEAKAAFQTMEQRLGAPLSAHFASVSPDAVSASLSQVHRGVLHDGRAVAIKLQYPGIADAVWHDLRALGWLTVPVGGLKRGFNLRAYQDEVRTILHEELNYLSEAENLRTMRRHAEDLEGVELPEVIEELTREKILTMTWMDGQPFSDVLHWPETERAAVAELFLRLFMTSCFKWRCLHGDPHPGNFRFRRDSGRPTVVLLDFGCVKTILPAVTDSLNWLIRSVAEGSVEDRSGEVYDKFLLMGFDEEMLSPMAHRLPSLSLALFKPFACDAPFDPQTWRLGESVEEILQEDRWNFRFAGPAAFLVLLRAYQGLLQYLKALKTPVDWQAMFFEIAGDAPLKPLELRRKAVRLPAGTKATNLRVRVRKSGRTTVALTFRAQTAAHLDELMPDDVIGALEKRGICLREISDGVVRSGFSPADLFELEENGKSVRVWLE